MFKIEKAILDTLERHERDWKGLYDIYDDVTKIDLPLPVFVVKEVSIKGGPTHITVEASLIHVPEDEIDCVWVEKVSGEKVVEQLSSVYPTQEDADACRDWCNEDRRIEDAKYVVYKMREEGVAELLDAIKRARKVLIHSEGLSDAEIIDEVVRILYGS